MLGTLKLPFIGPSLGVYRWQDSVQVLILRASVVLQHGVQRLRHTSMTLIKKKHPIETSLVCYHKDAVLTAMTPLGITG